MVSPDHPRVPLLFAIEWEATDDAARAMEAFVRQLAASRSWTVTRPVFVDELDAASSVDDDDEPIRTIGVAVEVLSGFPPFGERIPIDVDRAEWEDVSELVRRVAEFARDNDVEIVVEFDQEAIGWIKDGAPDRGVTEALLGEWRRAWSRRRRGGGDASRS